MSDDIGAQSAGSRDNESNEAISTPGAVSKEIAAASKPITDKPNIGAMTDTDLTALLAAAKAEHQKRLDATVYSGQIPLIAWEVGIKAESAWVQAVISLNLPPRKTPRDSSSKKGLWDIDGPKLPSYGSTTRGANPEGSFLMLCGADSDYDPYWARRILFNRLYILAQVRHGATVNVEMLGHAFTGSNLELVTSTASEIDIQSTVDKWPDLAPFAAEFCFPIYVALREAGM